MKLFITSLGLVLIACQSFRTIHQQQQQGLSGFVYRERGNRMPAHNRIQKAPVPVPVEASVYIYAATTQAQADGQMPEFYRINTGLISTVSTDSTGHFTVDLPVGKYSVFIKTPNGYYAAETDDHDVLNPVIIEPGKITEKNFVLRRRALY